MASERDIPILVPSPTAGTDDAEDDGGCQYTHYIEERYLDRHIVGVHSV